MNITDLPPLPTVIGPDCNGMSMTVEEFEAAEEWDRGYRYELVRGVLIVAPCPGGGERGPNDYLGYLLTNHQESPSNGTILDATLPEQDIRTSTGIRRADRGIWCGLGRMPVLGEDAPTIAVEFVSRTSRDRRRDYVEKRNEYAEAGIREFWVIDRFRRTMTVYVGATEKLIVQESDIYETALLPGFTLMLRKLLVRADAFGTP